MLLKVMVELEEAWRKLGGRTLSCTNIHTSVHTSTWVRGLTSSYEVERNGKELTTLRGGGAQWSTAAHGRA